MSKKRVAVAMSGGVDSSVAAAILKKQGYQVFGITMLLHSDYSDQAAEPAKRVADRLGIHHYVIDFREIFSQKVITPFCNEYKRGRTPNPCVNCNHYVKFGTLLNKARELGVDFMATGHYARIENLPDGYHLLKGVDHTKDQSYFLYTLGQGQLKHLLMPIGHLNKTGVKRMATELGLSDTIKHESQDICFIADNHLNLFIKEHIPLQPGDIVDTEGKILGRHKGLACYTIGQRQGLGLASDRRLYVIRLDAENNRLVAGSQEQLFTSRLFASQISWISGKAPEKADNITAKVRYKSPEVGANLYLDEDTAEVSFIQPQRAIAPGQSIVFYRGEEVLGGGIIEYSEPAKGNESDKGSIRAVFC
jgi:tRNA-specific 2-thiouridylase